MSGDYWNHNVAFHRRISTFEAVSCVVTRAPRESLAEIRAAASWMLPEARIRRRFYCRHTLLRDRPTEVL